MMTRDPHSLLPLAPMAYQILVALAEGENHGYGILKTIKERTGRRISPSTGTVYLALQRLEDDGLVEDAPGGAEGSRRRSYRLTRFGRQVAASEAERLLALVKQAAGVELIADPLAGGKGK